MALTPPPAAPQRGDRTTFANRVDAFITWLINFVSELVALVANLNSIAAGGAYALAYTYVNKGVIGDGAGKRMSFDGPSGFSTSTATLIYLENTDLKGPAAAAVASFAASTSAVKGQILVVAQGDASRWARFNVSGLNSYTNFKGLDVTLIDSSASNPFSYGETLLIQFQRTGDKGDTGATAFPTFRVQEQKPNSTPGGGSVVGVQARTLNTVSRNTLSGASLASNQVTLPAGIYKVSGSAPAYQVGAHQLMLYSVTGSATLLWGSQEMSAATDSVQSRSIVSGDFSLSSPTVIELRHWTSGAVGSYGLGYNGVSQAGATVIYAEILFEKVG